MDSQEMRLRCLEAAARLNRSYVSDAEIIASATAFASWVGPNDTLSGTLVPTRPTLGVSNKK